MTRKTDEQIRDERSWEMELAEVADREQKIRDMSEDLATACRMMYRQLTETLDAEVDPIVKATMDLLRDITDPSFL